jgi:DNA-binding LacI/PurR family transcriptional regulator/DNA-binding GntR family transcriptional regulator
MNRPHTPDQQAIEFLERAIATARNLRQTRLIPIKQLAQAAGVGHGVMGRAVAALRDRGILDVRRSRGIVLLPSGGRSVAVPQALPRVLRSEQLLQQLHADLSVGTFGFNRPLPSHKELAHRYSVAGGTLRKALGALVEEGVLIPHKRTYGPRTFVASTARNQIVLFAPAGTPMGKLVDYSSRTQGNFQSLELECLARGIRLRTVPCYYSGADTMTFAERKANSFTSDIDLRNVLGFMVWGMPHTTFAHELANWLGRFGKPIARFMEISRAAHSAEPQDHALVRRFAFQSDFEAGKQAGQYLLSLGHRRIHCLTALAQNDYSTGRIEGLRAAYGNAGYPDGVSVFDCGIKEPTLTEAERLAYLGQRFEDLARKGTRQDVDFSVTAKLAMIDHLSSTTYEELLRGRIESVFSKARGQKLVTAWVGMNDVVATICLSLLREKGVNAPGEISVMGFDDSLDAGYHGLTSYSFNGPAAMHAMVEHLVRPNSPRAARSGANPTLISGFVHERLTTGRARGAR